MFAPAHRFFRHSSRPRRYFGARTSKRPTDRPTDRVLPSLTPTLRGSILTNRFSLVMLKSRSSPMRDDFNLRFIPP